MHVTLECPRCTSALSFTVESSGESVACEACGHRITLWVPPPLRDKGVLERCVACGEYRLYRQKNFNRKAGLAVVLGSAGISLVLLPFSPVAAYGVLFLLALVDVGLYRLLPDVILCYRCRARHRGYGPGTRVAPFDLLTAEIVDQQDREPGNPPHPAPPADPR